MHFYLECKTLNIEQYLTALYEEKIHGALFEGKIPDFSQKE